MVVQTARKERSEIRSTLHAMVQGAGAQMEPGRSHGAKKFVYV